MTKHATKTFAQKNQQAQDLHIHPSPSSPDKNQKGDLEKGLPQTPSKKQDQTDLDIYLKKIHEKIHGLNKKLFSLYGLKTDFSQELSELLLTLDDLERVYTLVRKSE